MFKTTAILFVLLGLVSASYAYSGMATAYVAPGGSVDSTGQNMCEFAPSEIPSAFQHYFAAIPEAQWSYSHCGQCVKCTGAGGTVYAFIVDQCPSAAGSAGCGAFDVDFSSEAAKACTNEGWGEEPITWEFVSCPSTPFGGSSTTPSATKSPSPSPKPASPSPKPTTATTTTATKTTASPSPSPKPSPKPAGPTAEELAAQQKAAAQKAAAQAAEEKAAADAKKKADEAAKAQAAADAKAAEEKRIRDEKAAAEAKKIADEKAAAEAEAKRLADIKAAEAKALQVTQTANSGDLGNGDKKDLTADAIALFKKNAISSGTVTQQSVVQPKSAEESLTDSQKQDMANQAAAALNSASEMSNAANVGQESSGGNLAEEANKALSALAPSRRLSA